MTDYRALCVELFGTDDEAELRRIAGRLASGRKRVFDRSDIESIVKMQRQGKTTKEIADHFGVSRQTVSKYLNEPLDGGFVLRLDFMYKQKVCTEIYVDYRDKKVKIINRTDDIMKRAFGVNENPAWEDYEEFIEGRCMPRSRAMQKAVFARLGLGGYDPLEIAEKNCGRTAEDNQYIKFTRRRRTEL